jgi:drug/metabolite transporter (DMT)-like permease
LGTDNWFALAFASAVFSAGAALSQKKILFEMEALLFSFSLFVFVVLFSLPFVFYSDFSGLSFAAIFVLFLRSFLGALSFLFVMLSIKNMEISRALPLLALTPGIVAFFAFLLLKDNLTFIQICGMLLLLLGTYALEIKGRKKLLEPLKVFVKSKAHQYVIGALLLFTITAITDRALLNNYKFSPEPYFLIQQLFYLISFLLMLINSKNKNHIFVVLKNVNIIKWILLIAILTVSYRYTEILAIKIAPVALVLSVKRISIFFAVIIGGKLFNEKELTKKIIASALIIAGGFMITM